MSERWNRGDVFLIPLDEKNVGVGQIVDMVSPELYVVVYERTWSRQSPPPAEAVIGMTPFLASLTLDAKLYHGDWQIVGNIVENLSAIRLPLSKIRISGQMCVESHDGSMSRPATAEEEEKLRFRKTVAPVRLEKAFQAHHGLLDQHPAYEELRYDRVVDFSNLS